LTRWQKRLGDVEEAFEPEAAGQDDEESDEGAEGAGGDDVEGMSRVQDLVAANEGFVDRVQRRCTAAAMDQLDAKRQALLDVFAGEVLPLVAAFNAATSSTATEGTRRRAGRRAAVCHDSVNKAVWIRGAALGAMQAVADARAQDQGGGGCRVVHPRDRNGRAVSDCLSTAAAEAALAEYRDACDLAAAAVRAVLRCVLLCCCSLLLLLLLLAAGGPS